LGIAAYHGQQAAEKLSKGLLVLAATAFRKMHDLDELSEAAVAIYPDLVPLLFRARTYWGFAFRYPCRLRLKARPADSRGDRGNPAAAARPPDVSCDQGRLAAESRPRGVMHR
jgi:hypothetical protein